MRQVVFLLSLSLLISCAAAPGPETRADPGAPATSSETQALLLLLADSRVYEPYTIRQAIDGGRKERIELAKMLGQVGDERGLEPLQELLADGHPEVRREAAFALGLLGNQRASTALLWAAATGDRQTGLLAVESLGKLGVPLARVLTALEDLPAGERNQRLLPVLHQFTPQDRRQIAAAEVDNPDPQLARQAAYALTRDPSKASLQLLREMLTSADSQIRAWAARALGDVGEAEDLSRLRLLLADESIGPVVQALRGAKGIIGRGLAAAPRDWIPLLRDLLDDERAGVRRQAIEASAAWLLDETLGGILHLRATSGEGGEALAAVEALAAGGDPRARELAWKAGTSADAFQRRRAARIATLLADEDLLLVLATDREPTVRLATLEALLSEAGEDGEDIAVAALRDEDGYVRALALEWLSSHPVAGVENLRAAILKRDQGRAVVDSRLSGAAALEARARFEPLERGAVVAVLEEMVGDVDFAVRRKVAESLGALDRPQPLSGLPEDALNVYTFRQIVEQTRQPRVVEIVTRHGAMRLRLECPLAPVTCLRFLQLVGQGFYDGLGFHRVVPDFVVQAGDPRGDGWGGPGYTLRDEINRMRFDSGVIGMALSGANTGGSQFFITMSPQPHLDGHFTAFGRLIKGEEVLLEIVEGDRIERVFEVP